MKALYKMGFLHATALLYSSALLAQPKEATAAASEEVEMGAWHVTSRDAHPATWESVEMVSDPATGAVSSRNRSFTEVGSGMNYLDENGTWQRTDVEFRQVPGGFVAARGWYKVSLADNLNQEGAVEYTTPDGLTLKSAPLCLSYFDPVTGESVVLALLQDTVGRQMASNIVDFPNAFRELSATVRYTYQAGAFHQDLVLFESPPPPSQFGRFTSGIDHVVHVRFPPPEQDRSNTSEGGRSPQSADDGGTGFCGRNPAFR